MLVRSIPDVAKVCQAMMLSVTAPTLPTLYPFRHPQQLRPRLEMNLFERGALGCLRV